MTYDPYRKNSEERRAARNARRNAPDRKHLKTLRNKLRKRKFRAVAVKNYGPEDQRKIATMYELMAAYRLLGLDYHVDHIVPLNGKNVCGLHVGCNLQLLPAKDNLAKGNRL